MIIVEENNEEIQEYYKPEAHLIEKEEYNRISFTKKSADAVNVYRRKMSDEPWEFIGTAVHSPFDDHDTEERWVYLIRGVKGKHEIGQPVVLSNTNPGLPST